MSAVTKWPLFSKKVTLCPLTRNICLPFHKITSLSLPPQNVRPFRKFVISSRPRKNPMVWNNLYIISAAILPKNIYKTKIVLSRFVGLLSDKNYIVLKKQNYNLQCSKCLSDSRSMPNSSYKNFFYI